MVKPLPKAEGPVSLAEQTVMDRSLALLHGTPYVHLAVFAIDVDRVREALEDESLFSPELEATFALAWEVFLTAVYLESHCDPEKPELLAMLDDTCRSIMEFTGSNIDVGDVFGAQLPFAVFYLLRSGAWSQKKSLERLEKVFERWVRSKRSPAPPDLSAFEKERGTTVPALAEACLNYPLEPPLAPPTKLALTDMLAS